MRIPCVIASAFIILSCTNSTRTNPSVDILSQHDTGSIITGGQTSDSSRWTGNFFKLQKALTTGDRDAVKSFINFPIKSDGNEIWYLADSKLVMEIDPKEVKPFTETDFDKYFNSIFTLDLRETLKKLDNEEFFKTNKSTTPEIEVIKGSKSKLEASLDNSKNKITLALVTNLTEQGGLKFTIYFQFDILDKQNIEFAGVHVE